MSYFKFTKLYAFKTLYYIGIYQNMKFAIKAGIIFFILILSVVILSQINFPSPNKKIEVILPNENFKTIK